VAARAEDIGTRREIGIKWLSPWANDHWNPIYQEHIHAAVGQDALREFGRRVYPLNPETEQVFSESWGRAEFAVIRNCNAHIEFLRFPSLPQKVASEDEVL
jgi:hypothetical protein